MDNEAPPEARQETGFILGVAALQQPGGRREAHLQARETRVNRRRERDQNNVARQALAGVP